MKVLFLQRDPFAQMGVMMISAMAREAGHESFLFIENLEKNIDAKIQALNPDVICFSVATGAHQWACQTAKRIKNFSDAKVILGGPHATSSPDIIQEEGIDIVCRGEGEHAFYELMGKLQKKEPLENVRNLWIKKGGKVFKNELRPLIMDLDSLPFLDRSVYDRYRYLKLYYEHEMVFMASRGCPFNCSYCFNESTRQLYPHQRYVRRRSVDSVISELKEIRQKYRARGIHFYDDIFVLDQNWIAHFCDVYKKEIKLPFTCLGHFEFLNRKIVKDLKGAGCVTIKIGLEAGNENLRKRILNRRISNEKIYEVCRVIKEEKLDMILYNMLGYPGSSFKEDLETVRMNIKIKPKFSQFWLNTPLPNTEMTAYAIKNGYLPKDFNFNQTSDFALAQSFYGIKDKRRILNLQRFATVVVYFPFLLPLVKLLVRLPSNIIYYIIFQASFAYTTWRIHRFSLVDFIKAGLKTLPFLQAKNRTLLSR